MAFEEAILGGLRGLHLIALSLVAGGGLVARLTGDLPNARAIRPLLWVTMLAGFGWLLWQAQVAVDYAFPRAQWLLLTGTGFGRVMVLRLVLLAAALAVPRGRLALVMIAIGLQPLLGHGAALDWREALSGALHVLAGTLWAGSILALWWLAKTRPEAALVAARRFSPLGLLLLAGLSLGIFGQWSLTGGVPGLLGTFYGKLLLVKGALLALMLVCAALNGIWFARDGMVIALRRSLAAEGGLGLMVILVAALMATQMPGAHDTVVWPFAHRPVPDLWDDSFLRNRLWRIALPLSGGLILILLALLSLRLSRYAPFALLLLAGVLFWRVPHFPAAPFFSPAVPTSFQTSDIRRNPVTLLAGQRIFLRDCAGCHGVDARGKGPKAMGDPVWPPDLTSAYFRKTTDGDWFWRIRHGMTTNDGRASMPGSPGLTAPDIWGIVDFLRANASARSLDRQGQWQLPPLAPSLRLRCEGVARAIDLQRPPDGMPLLLGQGQVPETALHLDAERCTALSNEALAALALLSGGENPPTAVLIDGDGFLRQFWNAPPDSDTLARAVEAAKANPAAALGGHH